MNIKLFFLVSMILTSLFCFSNVVSAYSLDDFSKEYPKAKIESRHTTDDAGADVTTRWSKVLRLSTDGIYDTKFWFNIIECNGVKSVEVKAQYLGANWMFYDHLTIGNGVTAKDIYTSCAPFRDLSCGGVEEDLYFRIDRENLETWKNPKSIRIYGEKYYTQVEFNPEKYANAMKIIEKFLALN